MMGIEGYHKTDTHISGHTQKQAKLILEEIHADQQGSPSELFHGFASELKGEVGDTVRIPTTATSGTRWGPKALPDSEMYDKTPTQQGISDAESWAAGRPYNHKGSTIIVFEKGTPMAGYSKNEKEFRKENGTWGEAIVAGKFKITKIESHTPYPRYMERDPSSREVIQWQPPMRVVYVRNVGVFDPGTRRWVDRG